MAKTAETVTKSGSGRGSRADLLALGFGTTLAMWAFGYFLRLPLDYGTGVLETRVPGLVVFVLMIACVVGGGWAAGRFTSRGVLGGAWTGGIAGVLNLLIFGSMMSGDQAGELRAAAMLWLLGSPLGGAALGALGAALAGKPKRQLDLDWPMHFAHVAAGFTLLLILAGGLVTSAEEGLAVPDWPNSFGHNMFLYPLAQMTGGIYYEHAHRLLGSLVGLITLVLAIFLARGSWPRWVKYMGWGAVVMVIIQGILGGLRVAGWFTLSQEDVEPNIYYGIVHGVLGQVFFGWLVALGVVMSRAWRALARREPSEKHRTERLFIAILPIMLVVQLVLGAILRHVFGGLNLHITIAVIVLGLAVVVSLRAWGVYGGNPRLNFAGLMLGYGAVLQLALGIATLALTGWNGGRPPEIAMVIVATVHQTVGAFLLALSIYIGAWIYRLLPVPAKD